MMLVSLFPVLLLALRAAQLDGVAAPLLTFKDTDPITGKQLECDRCPPGTYLRARCTETQRSECAPCPSGSFTELWNYIGKCLRCGVCGQNQVVKIPCTAESDCKCQCKQGYYFKKTYDMCLRHSECQPGQGVLTEGTADEDTVCHICPNGTYSDTASAHQNCTEHKSCDNTAGLQLVLKGSTWHNNLCASCGEQQSKDGADYLRDIILPFFVHHKISIRRLRRIVHKLPFGNNTEQDGASRLNLSDLYKLINTWVASATATQIRQLPDILIKTGANGAGERLLNKLRRIDSHLIEMCHLRNEVDVVLG